ncbi:MAG: hypothetical protein Q9191_005258 [Dirinaria sp. TL-2023a]
MDEFAQTRQPDDLFDDDFTPINEPVPHTVQQHRSQSHKSPTKSRSQNAQPKEISPRTEVNTTDESIVASPKQAPKAPSAVRGDRSATGGVNKPKLTEDELSARLAAAKLNNAKREEAHRLAAADEASFQKREAHAQQKRKEEGAARRVMDQEREKNRLRKLAVKGGREWDEGKEDLDTRNERGSQFRRGAYGGVASPGGHEQTSDQAVRGIGRGRGRGRGGRNRGGRGGRGREAPEDGLQEVLPIGQQDDFPTLPAAKPTSGKPTAENASGPPASTTGENQSWADQVEKAEPVKGQ